MAYINGFTEYDAVNGRRVIICMEKVKKQK